MKKKLIFFSVLLILLSTYIPQKKITISGFKIKEIKIENNTILEDDELIEAFSFLYGKNIIFLNSFEINKNIEKTNFIKKIEIKKIFPDKLVIKVIEKKPVAILIDSNKKKFYLEKNNDLVEYFEISKYKNLPVVKGDHKSFKKLFNNLIRVNFPVEQVHSYHFFMAGRWDIKMKDETIIKLPTKNYIKDLINFMSIKNKTNFEKYKIFDYRLNNQLILK